MTQKQQLMPCPFCGCADIGCEPTKPRDPQSLFMAGCQGCNARTAPGYGFRGAAENWNRRAMMSTKVSEPYSPIDSPPTGFVDKAKYFAFLTLYVSTVPIVIFLVLYLFVFPGESLVSLVFVFFLNFPLMYFQLPYFCDGATYIFKTKHVTFKSILARCAYLSRLRARYRGLRPIDFSDINLIPPDYYSSSKDS